MWREGSGEARIMCIDKVEYQVEGCGGKAVERHG